MKELIVRVSDSKLQFVLELVEQLGFEVKSKEDEIPEILKEIVRDRIKNAQSSDFISWDEARTQLKFKDK